MEAPTLLSEAGWAAAWDYGARTVVDLRNPGEGEPDHALRPSGITTVNAPLDPVDTPFYEHWVKVDSLSSPLYYAPLLAEYPELVIEAVRAIANAAPGCVVFHCASGKDRTGLLSLILLTLAEATPDEIIADYLLTYNRLKPLHATVTELLATHGTTFEASLEATIAAAPMPDFLLDNGLTEAELDALRTRLTQPAVK